MTQIQPSLGTFPPAPIPSSTYRHALFPCTPPLLRCLATDLFTTSTAFISKRYVSASLHGLACPLGAALQWSCEVAECIGDLSPARLTQSGCASARTRLCGRRADAWSAPAGGAVVASFVVCEVAARAPQRLHHPRSPGAAWMTPSPTASPARGQRAGTHRPRVTGMSHVRFRSGLLHTTEAIFTYLLSLKYECAVMLSILFWNDLIKLE